MRKFEIQQKRIVPIKNRFLRSNHKKTKIMRPDKIDRVEAEVQATHTHTQTHIQTFFKNHVFWFLTPWKTIITCFYNNSKNYYHKASSIWGSKIFFIVIYLRIMISYLLISATNFLQILMLQTNHSSRIDENSFR